MDYLQEINSLDITRLERNKVIRHIMNILVDKYYVNQSKIAHEIGFAPKYLRDFTAGDRNFGYENLSLLESFIFDLYKPLIEDELPDEEDTFLFMINKIIED